MAGPRIVISTDVKADLDSVWDAWTNPADIKQWNAASEDWHTTDSEVDLREGGRFTSRMAAKDGSMAFDFAGTYSRIVPSELIEFVLDDERGVSVQFERIGESVRVTETFDADPSHDAEMQRAGWQAILDNFARHVESR